MERARLVEALGQDRNVQLIGPTGIGRTTLLRHVAHRNLLTIPDIEALVWTASQLPDADEILRAVVAQYCEFPPDRPIPSPVLRHALTGLRALVIVEDPLCTAGDLATVLRDSMLVVGDGRYRLAAGVGKLEVDVVAVTERATAWVANTVDRQEIAVET